jgi:hypothetical protein
LLNTLTVSAIHAQGRILSLFFPAAVHRIPLQTATDQGTQPIEAAAAAQPAGGTTLCMTLPRLPCCRTVQKLSGGSFTAGMLIGAVCVGVGVAW